MKISIKSILPLFLIAISCVSLSVQKTQRQNNAPEITKSFDINQYKDWQKVDFNELSLYVPKDFKIEKKQGNDLNFWRYKNESIDLKMYYGSNLPKRSPSRERLPSFDEKSIYINNIFTNIWSYEYEVTYYPFKFIYSARYFTDRENTTKGLVIFIGAKNESKELAEKVFHSVKLKTSQQLKLSK